MNRRFWLGVLIINVLLGIRFGTGMPEGVHSWAQSDRLSIAVNFVENYSFLEPRTHSLISREGEVGVEFPLVQFLSAGIKRTIPTVDISTIYRILTGLFLALGLAWFITSFHVHRSLLLPLYVLSMSPIAYYYQFNFLPDTAALGLLLGAIGSFNRFLNRKTLFAGTATILLAGMATLVKTSCGIYFIAISSSFFINVLFFEKLRRKSILPAVIAIVLGMFIYWYDLVHFYERNERLWSLIFLSKPLPVSSWSEVVDIWKNTRTWHSDYLSIVQYLLIAFILIGITVRRIALPNIFKNHAFRTLVASAIGAIIYALLIGMQFSNHDYYFLCTFYPVAIWAMLYGIQSLYGVKKLNQGYWKAVLYPLAIVHLAISLSSASERRSEYYTVRDRVIINETDWLKDADREIEVMGVPSEAKVFVFYEFAPNTSLLYFNRKGRVLNHEEMSRPHTYIDEWIGRIQPDYFVVRNKWLPNLKRDQPEIVENAQLVGSNELFSVYKFNQD